MSVVLFKKSELLLEFAASGYCGIENPLPIPILNPFFSNLSETSGHLDSQNSSFNLQNLQLWEIKVRKLYDALVNRN